MSSMPSPSRSRTRGLIESLPCPKPPPASLPGRLGGSGGSSSGKAGLGGGRGGSLEFLGGSSCVAQGGAASDRVPLKLLAILIDKEEKRSIFLNGSFIPPRPGCILIGEVVPGVVGPGVGFTPLTD